LVFAKNLARSVHAQSLIV